VGCRFTLCLVLGYFCFHYLLCVVLLDFWYCILEYLRGDVGWSFLSICYKRTAAFLVARIYLIEYDRGFLILLVNLLVRLTVFRCFSVFTPCSWSCSTLWMFVSSLVC